MSSNTPSIDHVCEQALRLPCSPALLPRLSAVLISNESSADEIADIIKLDASLAAATLRLANSAYFTTGAVETIADAVVRLGQRELYRLAALALVSRWESVSTTGEPGDFCRHAVCTALAAEVLAETSERVDPQMAYTAGLVCDLGKLAVAHACAGYFPAILDRATKHHQAWMEAEQAILGYTHTQVAARLLAAWSFPPLLTVAVEFCETPRRGPAHALPLLAHLHAGKYIATSFGPGVAEEAFLFELDAAFLLEWGFTPELLQETMAIVHDRAKQRLHVSLSYGALP